MQDSLLYARECLPGAVIARKEDIVINKGHERVRLRVTNTGDCSVQVCTIHKRNMNVTLNNHRLAHTTTSSRRMLPSLLIAAARPGNALTFQRVLFRTLHGT